jgi:hypothetical protein
MVSLNCLHSMKRQLIALQAYGKFSCNYGSLAFPSALSFGKTIPCTEWGEAWSYVRLASNCGVLSFYRCTYIIYQSKGKVKYIPLSFTPKFLCNRRLNVSFCLVQIKWICSLLIIQRNHEVKIAGNCTQSILNIFIFYVAGMPLYYMKRSFKFMGFKTD